MGRGNQYIQLLKVMYCKLPTNCKNLPAYPLEVRPGFELLSQGWEASVLPLCPCGPVLICMRYTRLISGQNKAECIFHDKQGRR